MTGSTTRAAESSGRSIAARLASEAGVWLLVVLTSLESDTGSPDQFTSLSGIDPVPLAGACAMAAVLLLRRRRPLGVFAVVGTASVVLALAGHQSPGGIIATGIAVYQVARLGRRQVTIVCAALAVVALGSILVVQYRQSLVPAFSILAIIGLAAALGDAVQGRRASMIERARQAEEAREQEVQRRVIDERVGIARELHDAAAHQIAVINLHAGAGAAALESGRTADAMRSLTTIQNSASNVLSEIAALLVVLRDPDGNADEHLPPVHGLGDLSTLIHSFEESGLHVAYARNVTIPPISGAVDVVAYKLIQEALTNAHKHGGRTTARLEIAAEGSHLRIVVTNALPLNRERPLPVSGHGLTGMHERVSSVRGVLHTIVGADEFTVDIHLPLTMESTT